MMTSRALVIIKPLKPPTNFKILSGELAKAATPEEVLQFEARVAGMEAYMRKAAFSQGDMHEINEYRMRARWRLGQMLASVEKPHVVGPGRGKIGQKTNSQGGNLFRDLLKRLHLDKNRAQETQRIGALPKIELEKCFQRARKAGELVTVTRLVDEARPYWYKARCKVRHQNIKANAARAKVEGKVGPFILIYADPPWQFELYSEKGIERSPEQHYPVLSDREIINFQIGNTSMNELACKEAVLFLWCTSPSILRACAVMEAWGFSYKSHAIWDKQKIGMGYIFRNQHEVLLYGTKGDMPAPQYQPHSIFSFPRGRHSAKPPEIRRAIEMMYPDFDERTRCELFCRDKLDGWTTFGFEA